MDLRAVVAKRRQDDRKSAEENDNKRLRAVVAKRLRTTFIGALATFEAAFGRLWGHGLPDGKLSEEQRRYRAVWNDVRNQILNAGNSQLRAAEAEIGSHTVSKNSKQVVFPASGR